MKLFLALFLTFFQILLIGAPTNEVSIKFDKILSSFLESSDEWYTNLVITGSWAPLIYTLYFSDNVGGCPLPSLPLDLDVLIFPNLDLKTKKDISFHLKNAGFHPVKKHQDLPPSFRKIIEDKILDIEFITLIPENIHRSYLVNIGGITAIALKDLIGLHSLKIITYRTLQGKTGLVLSPGYWLFIKGLFFNEVFRTHKNTTDLYGIWYVLTQLGTFSEKAFQELIFFKKTHPLLYKQFSNKLEEWVNKASRYDWAQLEAYDPSKKLKKTDFEHLILRIIY